MGNIILIGMPACGKSTIGVVLAKAAQKAFLDTDLIIQEKKGESLQNLVDKLGHDSFIRLEEEIITSISVVNTVIATGGSVVYSTEAMEHLGRLGSIIYIKLSLPTIEERLHNLCSRGIAMKDGESLKDLYDKRVPLYERYGDVVIEGEGLSVEQIIERIISKIP